MSVLGLSLVKARAEIPVSHPSRGKINELSHHVAAVGVPVAHIDQVCALRLTHDNLSGLLVKCRHGIAINMMRGDSTL